MVGIFFMNSLFYVGFKNRDFVIKLF